MGFQASDDAYTKRFDDITVDCPRKARIINDTILWDSNLEDSFWHTLDYITHCAKNGIIFNSKKFEFGRDEVDFGRFSVTKDGMKPTSDMTDAISSFLTPQNITGICSWFGLVNQVAYAFAQAEFMAPFRELLSTKNQKFYWDEALESAFQQSKQKIVEMISEGVQSFEIDQPTLSPVTGARQVLDFFFASSTAPAQPRMALNVETATGS